MWKKNDVIMNFKAVSDPKIFSEKCQTIIWKSKGENGYFVTVHDCSADANLINFKWHPDRGTRYAVPIEIHPYIFERILNKLAEAPEEEEIALDVTSTNPYFAMIWKSMLSKHAFVDEIPWSEKGTHFMVNMLLEDHYAKINKAEKTNTKTDDKFSPMHDVFPF